MTTLAKEMHAPVQEPALTSPPLYITEAAALKIKELMDEEGDAELRLRIYITGGGCSGFQYNFSFDAQSAEDDTIVTKTLPEKNEAPIAVIIDSMSLPFLEGATVDYKNDVSGERFVISNPNAKSTCGCGSSFDA